MTSPETSDEREPVLGRHVSRRDLLGRTLKLGAGLGTVTLLGSGLVACGDDDDEGSDVGDSTNTPGAEPSSTAGPVSGGTLVIGNFDEIITPDPTSTRNIATLKASYQVYESLRSVDLNGDPNGPIVLESRLAESHEQPEATTITYHLRKGATFHDGTPFNAEAVKISFERLTQESSPYFSEVGKGSTNAELSRLEGIDTSDEFTVTMRLKEPFFDFHRQTAYAATGIVSPTALETYGTDDFAFHPSGTGPFQLDSLAAGADLRLNRYDGYWGDKAYLDSVVFRPMKDINARVSALEAGEIDWAIGLNSDALAPIPDSAAISIVKKSSGLTFHVLLSELGLPTSDKKVRQAINMLVDREEILAAYGGQDVPAYGPATPGTGAYRADFTPYPNGDVAEAKKLLDAAGVADGFDVECIFRITGQSAPTPPEAALLQQQLAEAGINMSINPQDQTAFPAAVYGAPLEGKWGQNGLFGYTAFFAVRRSFASTSVPPGGLNSGAYMSDALDELDRRIQAATSQEEYDELWREANELTSDDAPWAYLYHRTDIDALSDSVHGYAGAQDTYFDLRQVWKG